MEVNVYLVAIAPPIVKWVLMLEVTPSEVKILFDLPVLGAEYVLRFVRGVF